MEATRGSRAKSMFSQNAIWIVLIALIAVITIMDTSFLSVTVFRDMLVQSSTRLIIALGAAFILITAGTDLSAGRVVGLTAVVSASMLQNPEYANKFFPDLPYLPMFLPILVAIIVGLIGGLVRWLPCTARIRCTSI
jgi:methyl-galactoside transport system permease protein